MLNKSKIFLVVWTLLLTGPAFAQKATLVEDISDPAPQVGRKWRDDLKKDLQKDTNEVTESFDSAYSLRAHRRMAVGSEVMGEYGLIGAFAELNFAADDSATLGFGGGFNYSTFALNWRHIFGGKTFSPFVSVGIAHWYANGNGGSLNSTTPSFLGNSFLTGSEMSTDRFALDFLTPAAGLQYNFLNGAYTGLSIYGQLLVMTGLRTLSSLQTAPVASAGALYYF